MKPEPAKFETTLTNFKRSDMRPREAEDELCLIMMSGPRVGQVYQLTREETLLGRDDAADVQLLDQGISRRHALVRLDTQRSEVSIEDLGSHNGTLVNNERIDAAARTLAVGDKVKLGLHTIIRLSSTLEVETRYALDMFQAMRRDTLTGIYNRRHLDERLAAEVSFSRRHESSLSVLFIDIDHFKRVNDDHDHQVGDAVLRQVAQLMERMVRTEDELARYGGEEFAIICRQTPEAQAAVMAERIRVGVEACCFEAKGHTIPVTISIGVASLGPGLTGEDELVAAADAALLAAKGQGRNRVIMASAIPARIDRQL